MLSLCSGMGNLISLSECAGYSFISRMRSCMLMHIKDLAPSGLCAGRDN